MQALPAEKLAADGTALRGFSPQDIADIVFAATPAPTVQTGSSYTLALADNHLLVEGANASAITVMVPTKDAVAFPLGARIEIVQAAPAKSPSPAPASRCGCRQARRRRPACSTP